MTFFVWHALFKLAPIINVNEISINSKSTFSQHDLTMTVVTEKSTIQFTSVILVNHYYMYCIKNCIDVVDK